MKLIDADKIDFTLIKDPFDRAMAELLIKGCPPVQIQRRMDELKTLIDETANEIARKIYIKNNEETIVVQFCDLDMDTQLNFQRLMGLKTAYEMICGKKEDLTGWL